MIAADRAKHALRTVIVVACWLWLAWHLTNIIVTHGWFGVLIIAASVGIGAGLGLVIGWAQWEVRDLWRRFHDRRR